MDWNQAWMWIDFTGRGKRWQLAVRSGGMIQFPHADWQEHAENLDDCPVVPIERPTEPPAMTRDEAE